MLADFHSSGIIPVLYISLNNIDKGLQRLIEQFFKTLPCIPSGPEALLTVILSNKSLILEQLKSILNKSSFEKSMSTS